MSDENRETKNAVFGGRPEGVDPAIPVMTVAERMKADLGVDLPVESVILPSLGKCYPPGHPLHDKQSVDIRAMTAREEDILMNRAYLKKGIAISKLLKSCLVDQSIDPSSMLAGDRNAVLVAIRISGYGPNYPVELECSECEEKYDYEFDLTQLPVRTLELEPVQPFQNIFEFRLPRTKKIVGFKFLTGADEEETTEMTTKQKKLKLQPDSALVSSLLHAVVSLDGNTDRSRIAQFVRNMPAMDSLALRTYIRENEPSIVFKQAATCSSCENTEEVNVQLGVSFLWPSAGK